ncbi:BTB/POZ and TAZ domain-containing protein 3 [Telopea speciosissima]|uniref:BTB/POZ and TAZ domain-containing protein 3 n=1 Tax=Telopea speciosissima TaxID=54955 RepID=UPI001CC70C0D|nr:BTB/POZ and TAZ domain-containing protein 3 [Telopea speciosissima]
MSQSELDSSWVSSIGNSFKNSLGIQIEEETPADFLPILEAFTSSQCHISNIPLPPPLPSANCRSRTNFRKQLDNCSYVPKETRDTWDKLFKEGYRADVHILTEYNAIFPAHSSVLGVASPVLRNFVLQAKVKDGIHYIKVTGVPSEAVHLFIRFLYSSCYEKDELKKFVLHLLVLSHSFSIPSLKRVCIDHLEQDWLTTDNTVDVLQLARKCDSPRLSLICVHRIVKDFKTISGTEGWKVMKQANPALEQELLESVVEADSRKEEKVKKMEEKKICLQLYETMEALLHVCKDGCRTIGPCDKVLKASQVSCGFPACKGVETLVRHFSSCKTRIPGGCIQCKRMWQMLELHSRMCIDPDYCKVPLCGHFKEKMQHHSKKDDMKWRLLVTKVIAVKNTKGPFSAWRPAML